MSGTEKTPGPEPTAAVVDAVRERARDGRISCSALRKTAEEQGVPYREAGSAADREGIKVVSCDLGCF